MRRSFESGCVRRHFAAAAGRLPLAAAVSALASHTASFSTSPVLRGLDQVQDAPTSTTRKPTGLHRGPGKRLTSAREVAEYQFIKKWDLTMKDTWDDLEVFRSLPKPKKQFGNEASEIVWPYAMLLERVVKIHPFTKSVYVYYGQRQQTEEGQRATEAAKRFAREFLIPITFHNSQVYVETEMLLEYNETPWVVIHCLDGSQRLVAVKPSEGLNTLEAAEELLATVVREADTLSQGVKNPKEVTRQLNERPLQNQYLRIDYQWYGDTPEERMSHLVQWDFDPAAVEPKMRNRTRHVLNWLNYDGNLPNHNSVRNNVRRESARMRSPKTSQGPRTFFNSGSRANARYSRFGGGRAAGQ